MKKNIFLILVILVAGCGGATSKFAFWRSEEPQPKKLAAIKNVFDVTVSGHMVNLGRPFKDDFVNIKPAVLSDKVVIAGIDGQLRVYSKKDHKLLWQTQFEEGVTAGPTVDERNKRIAVIDRRRGALIYDLVSGKRIHRFQLPEDVYAMPELNGDELVVKTLDEELRVYSVASKQLRWNYRPAVEPISVRASSKPHINGARLFVGFSDGSVYAFDRYRGNILWSQHLNDIRSTEDVEERYDIVSDPISDKRNLYIASFDGQLAALDLATGEKRWQQAMGSYKNLVMNRDFIFAVAKDDTLYAIRKDLGRIAWKQNELQYRNISAPVEDGNKLVVYDKLGYLHWLSEETGITLARFPISQPLDGSLLASDEYDVYVTEANGTVTSIHHG